MDSTFILSRFRGMINTVTLAIAFVLSIMIINTNRQCKAGKGYDTSTPIVSMSYVLAVIILVVACLLFGFDIFSMVMKKRM